MLTIFFAFNVQKLKIVFSAEDLAGEGLESALEIKDLQSRYQDGITSLFLISPKNGTTFTPNELCNIRKWYSETKSTLPEINQAISTFDFKIVGRDLDHNRLYTTNLLALDCDLNLKKFEDKEVIKNLNKSPFAMANERGPRLNLIFNFTFSPSTVSKFGSFDPKLIEKLRASVDQELKKKVPNIKVYWFGPGDYQWSILEGMRYSKYVNLSMILLMIIGLRIFMGTFQSGAIFVASLIISTIWLFGLKGVVGSSYDVLCTGLILILGISSLEDFVFVSYDQLKTRSYLDSIKSLSLPSFYTSLTTVLGFLSLYISDVAAIRKMGIWASWGALVEWFVVFIYIPCFLMQIKSYSTWVNIKRHKIPGIFYQSTNKCFKFPLTTISLLVFPLTALLFHNLNFNISPIDMFPKKQEYHVAIDEIKTTKGWVGNVSLVFDKVLSEKEID
ncbi:MAG: hypothetical protein ACXVCE_15010, partial [Bacteriovorax sp.]